MAWFARCSARHVVSAFVTDRKLILAQVATDLGTNERVIAHEVVKLIDLARSMPGQMR